jgi:glyoxylase I family protein
MTTSPEQAHETVTATDDEALTFRGVDHVSLTVTNLSISAQFYTEVLGFTVVLDFGYALACMHKTTGFTLSLIRHPDGTGTRFTHRQTGLDHRTVTARNRAELLDWEQRLRELDVEFTPVQDSELGHHLNFRDPMGSLWSSTLLMTVSRLSWMNCAAANSPTKTYWTRRSGWDWGRASHGESDDSLANAAGPGKRTGRARRVGYYLAARWAS